MSMEKIRLNKYLSDAGVCSRREADSSDTTRACKLVTAEKAVTGEKVSVEPTNTVDNREIRQGQPKVLLLLNKPRGIICTAKNQKDNIVDFLNYPIRVYPVGRLDVDSQD